MINTEAVPPEEFSFYYQVEYSNIHKNFKEYDYEERHYLLVNGETSVVKEEFRMKDDTMLNRKPFNNLLDYVKSKYLEQDHLWKELHYLKNFKIYSLLNH